MGLAKNIVLISSGQPSANPRLVKEAIALDNAGYKVTVIYVPISPWADQFDELLTKNYPSIKFVRTGYHPHDHRIGYNLARLRRKLFFELFKRLGDIFNIADYSSVLYCQELVKEAMRHKAELYIAHNLGALPVAIKAAKLYNAKVGFDAEDFHRGEFAAGSIDQHLTILLEQKYFKELNYLTAASPLIAVAYRELFPNLSPVTINNVFPLRKASCLSASNDSKDYLKLFWFSQVIGKQRGIEIIVRAMGILKQYPISLTLLGNITEDMKAYLLSCAREAGLEENQIIFLDPVLEEQIVGIASTHDIGFSSEVPHCLNREYCLTNKIFTYLVSGIALVMSDTKAQRNFLSDYPGIGVLYKFDDPQSLAEVLLMYIDDPALLRFHKTNAKGLAEGEMNWECESKKFLDTVASVLAL